MSQKSGRKASMDASSPPKSGGNTLGNEDGWNDQKTKELLGKMKQIVAKPDVSKYKTSLQRFEWKKVQLDQFSAEECKKQFFRVYKKLRKYKTLSDLVNDSLEYIENPYKGNIKKHPDHPKRPLTPYFRFFLSEREKFAAKHRDLTNLQITSILSEMYKKISIGDKERLMNSWKEEMVEYRQKLEQFKHDHPEYYDKTPPRLSRTPIQVFTSENSGTIHTAQPRAKLSKEDSDILKKKYHDLSDEEKLPYILKAIEEWEKYKEELEMFKKSHPDFKPTFAQNKCTLTQSDWRIHDKSLGKPDRPPANGYNLFCTRMMVSEGMKHLTSRERIIECGQKWKLLTEAEKQAYQSEFLTMRASFKVELKNFMKSLTPRQKQEYLEREKYVESKKTVKRKMAVRIKEEPMSNDESSSEETEMGIVDDETSSESSSSDSSDDDEDIEEQTTKSDSKKSATISAPAHRPTTPISALFLYQKAHKEKFAAKHPNASKSDITIMLARRFNNLPKEKRAKWIQQEKEKRALHNDMLRRKLLEENTKNAPPELRPVTGEQIFQEQNKGSYLRKANGASEKAQELMRRAWTQMNKEKKKKYITIAHEQNAKNIAQHQAAKAAAKDTTADTHTVVVPVERNLSQKEIKSYLALEPKKVPSAAVTLFKTELKPRLNHLTPAARNKELTRLWNSMTATAKNNYKERVKAGLQEYDKKLERWIKSLPPQAHQAYQLALNKRTKVKSKTANDGITNGSAKKRKAETAGKIETPKKAKPSKEESDESSDESSGDDSSSSSSDDSDDDSSSSSSDDDSSSDSDSSGSEEEQTPKKRPPAKDDSSGDSSSSSDDDSDSD